MLAKYSTTTGLHGATLKSTQKIKDLLLIIFSDLNYQILNLCGRQRIDVVDAKAYVTLAIFSLQLVSQILLRDKLHARKIAQCNIPCHRHRMQHFYYHHRCKK